MNPDFLGPEPLFEYAPVRSVLRKAGCIFCLPDDPTLNTVVARGKRLYARLDNYPASAGHIEIVPIRHIESFFDLDDDEIREMRTLIRDVRGDIEYRYHPDGYTIGINDGSAAGRTVHHLHVHIIPRYFGDVEDPTGGIRKIFPGFNPEAWLS